MKKTLFLLFAVCFSMFITAVKAQKNEVNPNGYNKFYYGNGQLSSEGRMVNGKPDGYWKTYYINGQLKSEGNRVNHQLDSIWVFYNEEGDTTKKINYLYGVKNGYSYHYTSTNNPDNPNPLVAKILYVEGLKQGISTFYFPDGALKRKVQYKGGKKHGYEKVFNKDGRIIELHEYHNGYEISEETINRYNAQNKKTGKWVTFHPNGAIKKEAFYRNGELQGLVKNYDDDGNLIETQRYDKGKPVENQVAKADREVKIQEDFYESGQLKKRGGYVDNKPVGLHMQFDSTGSVVESRFYDYDGNLTGKGIVDKEGEKQGQWKWFYTNGNVKSKGRYKNNKKQGDWDYFYKNGQIEQEGAYKNGEFQGKWTWYYKNGEVLREEFFINGKSDGPYTEYSKDGKKIVEGRYVQGSKEGKWVYRIGDTSEKGTYVSDFKDGTWKHYYNDGTLKFEGAYSLGAPDGKHVHYYPSGKIRLEAFYRAGQKVKTWQWFDEEGLLLMTITYDKGKETRVDGWKIRQN